MKYLFALLAMLSLSLASAPTTHAGGGRPNFSYSRPSYSGFRSSSTPSYRSYSASPSRTFTYRASTPTYSRPATRTTYISSPAPTTYTSKSKTVVNNHYHGSPSAGSGGSSLMDYMMLDAVVNSHRQAPTYVTAQPAAAGAPTPVFVDADPVSYQSQAVVYQTESHGWRNFSLCILVLVVIAAIVAALVHYLDLDTEAD